MFQLFSLYMKWLKRMHVRRKEREKAIKKQQPGGGYFLRIFNFHECMHAQSLWPEALQAPQSMRFSRQEYWRGLPCPPSKGFFWPRDGTCISYIAGRLFTTAPPGKPSLAQSLHSLCHTFNSYLLSFYYVPTLMLDRFRPTDWLISKSLGYIWHPKFWYT